VIMRVWRARVDGPRVGEYERFAREASLPMFRDQPGFRGSLFGRSGDDCVVVTIWEDDEAADSLDVSRSYLETVSRLRAEGFISAELGVERFVVHASDQLDLGES
jgi:heme-degrading monooxygenase HmoA